MMLFGIFLLYHGLALISGTSADVHNFHHHERRLADHAQYNYTADYISVDCGSEKSYSVEGIYYMPDSAYIDTGINKKISSEFPMDGSINLIFRTLRSFPDGVRNCYTLKPSKDKGNNYLIRARFMHGNYDGNNTTPIFDMYIGVNFWSRVSLESASTKRFIEIIHKSTTDAINVCLVNIGQGTPFISALFLEPLSNSIYHSHLGSLCFIDRYYAGPFEYNNDGASYNSYKDDIYDRYWSSIPSKFNISWAIYNTSINVNSITNNAYKVPPSIFKTQARPLNDATPFGFLQKSNDIQPVFYVYWHFAETKKLGYNESREFEIILNGTSVAGPIRPKYLHLLTIASPPIILGMAESQFIFLIKQTNVSTLPPFLNALEIYQVIVQQQSTTNQVDGDAIMDIKKQYGPIKGWQGDPCLPVTPWDGLNCSDSDPPRIISLNLASRGLTGELLPSIFSLTSLNYLNLSNNNLIGTIPEFLANMSSLQVIDLRRNNLNGPVPVKLQDRVTKGLLSLRLEGNPDLCTSDVCTKRSKKHRTLVPLIVSASLFVFLIAIGLYFACRRNKKQGLTNENITVDEMKSRGRQFTYSDVVKITNNYQIILGKGAFGTVYHGFLQDGSEVAVKMLNKSSSSLESFQTEAELLMRVHHKNLVPLIGYCEEGATLALVYEYMSNGDLKEQLSGEKTNVLSWKERLRIAIDAAQGLEYLHSGCRPAIVHRDMKTANILLDDNFQAKIADFGMSRIFPTESATHISTDHVAGTPGYLDPECHVSYKLNEKSDVYSFGVILLELITGQTAMIKSGITITHIVDYVNPFLARGDIFSIVDMRLHKEFGTNSAWRVLEIAMGCVASTGNQRPNMGQVLADLKDALGLELAYENSIQWANKHATCSSRRNFDSICTDSLAISTPSAR